MNDLSEMSALAEDAAALLKEPSNSSRRYYPHT